MANRLDGCRVAILVTDGFEEVELTRPRQALDDAGAETSIVSPKDGMVRSWRFTDWGQAFPVDVRHNAKIHRLALAEWAATAQEFEAKS